MKVCEPIQMGQCVRYNRGQYKKMIGKVIGFRTDSRHFNTLVKFEKGKPMWISGECLVKLVDNNTMPRMKVNSVTTHHSGIYYGTFINYTKTFMV